MRTPRRPTVALAATLWAAACGTVFWLPVRTWLIPLADRLPDNRYLQGLVTIAFGAVVMAFIHWAATAFPFWRALLTAEDRRQLWAGCTLGALAGLVFGIIAAFLVLEPDLMVPARSPRAMTAMWSVAFACTFAGALVAAIRLPRLATPADHDPSVPSVA